MIDRAAIFGGSFDPPHLAHAMACLWALLSGRIDRVILVPVGNHAYGKPTMASFADRAAMCRLAVAPLGQLVSVCDLESRRPGPSYMIDTVRALRDQFPETQFRILAGTDTAADIINWREGAEVLRLAPVLAVPRPDAALPLAAQPGALPAISSTLVRERLAQNADCTDLLAAPVQSYIRERGLYEVAEEP